MARTKLLHNSEARRIVADCTRTHAPDDRMWQVSVQEPGAWRYDIRVCGPCKKTAYNAQRHTDTL